MLRYMASVEEKLKPGGLVSGGHNHLLQGMKLLKEVQDHSGVRKEIHSELWHACAGPLVSLPQLGSLVYYFPQGHSEQVAASTNRTTNTHIPNYPNLSSHLLCQLHNVTLHADRETDEIYAQMSLQPVNSEKDVISIPNFGLKLSKHPTEFFCKTLTASDTSTHGGFSVPRRAAEKLFPQLDYSMQPPTQELVVRDLHNNTWTFRHIYRGQPKRHLLTTGWSMFIGAKRLKAGDAVLFIRDEKSQLMVGVRRLNRQPTNFPSSVLSADSMHIGILAAAAHAAASRSPFTIFYNPRACPSDFVIPFAKYQKAVYSTQLHVGMRFGMTFETEESSKRRYMGTITGISDLDPLRWPNSKWRCLQVEWDEPGFVDKQTRVSPWEIETPDNLFIFPSLTPNLKRPFHFAFVGAQAEWDTLMNRPFHRVPDNSPVDRTPMPTSLWSDQFMQMLVKPYRAISQVETSRGELCHFSNSSMLVPGPLMPNKLENQTSLETRSDLTKLDDLLATNQLTQFHSSNEEKLPVKPMNPPIPVNGFSVMDQSNGSIPLDTYTIQTQQNDSPQVEPLSANALLQYPRQVEFSSYPQISPSPSGYLTSPGSLSMVKKSDRHPTSPDTACLVPPSFGHELWDPHFTEAKCVYQTNLPMPSPHQGMSNFQYLKDVSDANHNQSDIYSCCFNLDGSNSGSTVIDPSVSSTVMEEYFTLKNADLQNPYDCLVGNLCSNQDVQSQITSASLSLADSQAFSVHEYPDNSGGGASSSNVEFDDNNILQHSSWQQVPPRFRTYTKIQKAGSVGRSTDVSSFKNYEELRCEIELMFGLEGLLNDLCSGWKLVYVDFENDVLLVGDDPWEEFVGCVKCIRILSPSEVQQMGEEGMQLLNSVGLETANASTSQVV